MCAAGADATEKSWRAGRVIERDSIDTIADGIGVRVPIPETLEDMRDHVDDVLLVDDDTIVGAMRLLHAKAGQLVEPAGAVGVAAILSQPERFAGRHVATVLCGSNLTDEQLRAWLSTRT